MIGSGVRLREGVRATGSNAKQAPGTIICTRFAFCMYDIICVNAKVSSEKKVDLTAAQCVPQLGWKTQNSVRGTYEKHEDVSYLSLGTRGSYD